MTDWDGGALKGGRLHQREKRRQERLCLDYGSSNCCPCASRKRGLYNPPLRTLRPLGCGSASADDPTAARHRHEQTPRRQSQTRFPATVLWIDKAAQMGMYLAPSELMSKASAHPHMVALFYGKSSASNGIFTPESRRSTFTRVFRLWGVGGLASVRVEANSEMELQRQRLGIVR